MMKRQKLQVRDLCVWQVFIRKAEEEWILLITSPPHLRDRALKKTERFMARNYPGWEIVSIYLLGTLDA
jgi:hypothetical protein